MLLAIYVCEASKKNLFRKKKKKASQEREKSWWFSWECSLLPPPPKEATPSAATPTEHIKMSFRSHGGSRSGSTSSGGGKGGGEEGGASSYKLVMVGDSGVGKSCILEKLVDAGSTNTFISTIGVDIRNHTLKEKNGRLVKLQVWDTGGQQRYRPVLSTCYRNADGVVVVFDLTNRKSFLNLAQWLSEVEEFTSYMSNQRTTAAAAARSATASASTESPSSGSQQQQTAAAPKLLLLGNKCDLESRRQVDGQTASAFAKDNNMIYVETSAIKATASIKEGFLSLVRPRLESASSTSSSHS